MQDQEGRCRIMKCLFTLDTRMMDKDGLAKIKTESVKAGRMVQVAE